MDTRLLSQHVASAGFVLITCIACGGANPYETNFQAEEEAALYPSESLEKADEVRIMRSDNPTNDAISIAEQGYVYLGRAEFTAGEVDSDRARSFAADINAAIVVLHSERAGIHMEYDTVQTYYPMSPQGAWTGGDQLVTGAGFPYEFGGYARGDTLEVSEPVQEFEYVASFWAKPHHSKRALGVHVLPLSPPMQQSLGLDHGVLIYAVVQGTPADAAELARGDIITHIAGEPIDVPGNFGKMLRERLGQATELTILRDGESLKKRVTLNPGAHWD